MFSTADTTNVKTSNIRDFKDFSMLLESLLDRCSDDEGINNETQHTYNVSTQRIINIPKHDQINDNIQKEINNIQEIDLNFNLETSTDQINEINITNKNNMKEINKTDVKNAHQMNINNDNIDKIQTNINDTIDIKNTHQMNINNDDKTQTNINDTIDEMQTNKNNEIQTNKNDEIHTNLDDEIRTNVNDNIEKYINNITNADNINDTTTINTNANCNIEKHINNDVINDINTNETDDINTNKTTINDNINTVNTNDINKYINDAIAIRNDLNVDDDIPMEQNVHTEDKNVKSDKLESLVESIFNDREDEKDTSPNQLIDKPLLSPFSDLYYHNVSTLNEEESHLDSDIELFIKSKKYTEKDIELCKTITLESHMNQILNYKNNLLIINLFIMSMCHDNFDNHFNNSQFYCILCQNSAKFSKLNIQKHVMKHTNHHTDLFEYLNIPYNNYIKGAFARLSINFKQIVKDRDLYINNNNVILNIYGKLRGSTKESTPKKEEQRHKMSIEDKIPPPSDSKSTSVNSELVSVSFLFKGISKKAYKTHVSNLNKILNNKISYTNLHVILSKETSNEELTDSDKAYIRKYKNEYQDVKKYKSTTNVVEKRMLKKKIFKVYKYELQYFNIFVLMKKYNMVNFIESIASYTYDDIYHKYLDVDSKNFINIIYAFKIYSNYFSDTVTLNDRSFNALIKFYKLDVAHSNRIQFIIINIMKYLFTPIIRVMVETGNRMPDSALLLHLFTHIKNGNRCVATRFTKKEDLCKITSDVINYITIDVLNRNYNVKNIETFVENLYNFDIHVYNGVLTSVYNNLLNYVIYILHLICEDVQISFIPGKTEYKSDIFAIHDLTFDQSSSFGINTSSNINNLILNDKFNSSKKRKMTEDVDGERFTKWIKI